MLYGVFRSLASLYKQLGHTNVDHFGKKSQDLVTNITFRGIMYHLITILAEYGFNPDKEENVWSDCGDFYQD